MTAIRVAGDAREAGRRVDEDDSKRMRREKLEAEAKAGAERFEEITKKWESALQKEIPQDLHEMLMQQKAACDAMIDEKNKLINEFQMELKQKDDHYVKDLKKQAEDIDLLIERMDEQVRQLTKAIYKEELEEVEKAFVAERTELLELHRKKWEQTMQQRRDKETDNMKGREKRVEDYEEQLQHLRIQDSEEYNQVKIKLETDVQILQQQLQQMKATYQLNQEKLEYNFQVLRKRDEENTITKSQQKRKITRLQDVLTNLKIKLAKQEKQYKDENVQLTDDYKRITEQFKELQKKSKHFMATDLKKFHDIWVMNEEEAKQLVQKLMEEDRITHEHQLGLPWNPPDLEFLDNVGPILSEKQKRQTASASRVVQEALSMSGVSTGNSSANPERAASETEQSEKSDAPKITIFSKLSHRVVKQILELLSDESGFLIETKLQKLLSPLERDEQSLMKLDAIFTALGVETEDDIQSLANYFLVPKTESKEESRKVSTVAGPDSDPATDVVREDSAVTADEDIDEADREVAKVTGRAGENEAVPESSPRSARSQAPDLIHPNEVTRALRKFVEDHREPPKDKGRDAQFKMAALDDRDNSDDTAYWAKYPAVLPEKTERLWEGLIDGMEKYSETLGSREKLIHETEGLRQQNAELRMLLHQYVNSKVNQELEIPPTRVLQMELNP